MLPKTAHCRTLLMNCGNTLERVTGIEPASRAWEPYIGALLQALSCGQPWSGVTLVDRC
jgi:hypothetical protein